MIFAVPGMRVRPCCCCNGGTVSVPPPSGGMSWMRGQRRRQHRTRRAARGVKPAPVQLGNEFFTVETAWMIRLDRGRRGRCLRSACAAMRAPALMYPGAALRRDDRVGVAGIALRMPRGRQQGHQANADNMNANSHGFQPAPCHAAQPARLINFRIGPMFLICPQSAGASSIGS